MHYSETALNPPCLSLTFKIRDFDIYNYRERFGFETKHNYFEGERGYQKVNERLSINLI